MGYLDQINQFVDTMVKEQGRFNEIQNEVSKVENRVKELLDELEREVSARVNIFGQEEIIKKELLVKEIFEGVAKDIDIGVSNVSKQIQETISGMKFIEDFEKKFTIAVFGKVKAGKSYIGNFVMGNSLKDNNIASSYDALRPMQVHVYDRGHLSVQGELATFEDDSEFATGKTETTSTIQWFDLGALSWFDTPGIGSVTWENEMLAKEYVKNADLVIYACNSDAAGTRQDFSEMKQLLEMKKPMLLLLTQSDTYEEDEDEDGNIISDLVAKSDKDRKDQEMYMLTTLQEQGMTEVLKFADILTVSAYLANHAIETGNEKKFQESNMGKLLEALIKITLNNAAEMKRTTPCNRINTMIDETIREIEEIKVAIEEKCSRISKNQEDIQNRKVSIVQKIKADITREVISYMDQQKTRVEKEGKSISEKEMVGYVNRVVNEVVNRVCSEELKTVRDSSLEMQIQNIGSMEMKKDKIEWEETQVKQVSRDPEGIIEHICHFFGKEYYTSVTKKVTRSKEIELGVNSADITGKLMKQLDLSLQKDVYGFIDSLCKGYYEPVSVLNTTVREILEDKSKEISDLRL